MTQYPKATSYRLETNDDGTEHVVIEWNVSSDVAVQLIKELYRQQPHEITSRY